MDQFSEANKIKGSCYHLGMKRTLTLNTRLSSINHLALLMIELVQHLHMLRKAIASLNVCKEPLQLATRLKNPIAYGLNQRYITSITARKQRSHRRTTLLTGPMQIYRVFSSS